MFGFSGGKGSGGKSAARDSQGSTPQSGYDFTKALADIRHNLGPAPRKVQSRDRIKMPGWVKSDDLQLIADNQDFLISHGDVTWAALVQVNQVMFHPAFVNAPGDLIYSTDPASHADPSILCRAARGLYSIKGQDTDPELRVFSEHLANEMKRTFKLRVPASLTQGIQSWFTTVMFERTHLPRSVMDGSAMPILFHPETEAVMVVPEAYWPDSLIRIFWG